MYVNYQLLFFIYSRFNSIFLIINPRQFALEQFAGGAFRNVVNKINFLRAFVIRQMIFAETYQFFFAPFSTLFQHYKRRHFLAVEFVGYADDRRRFN